MKDCCNHNNNDTKCIRKEDNKIFKLPRHIKKENCIQKDLKGFSVKSSCAPYKNCKKKFLYNKNNPKISRDIFSNDNPNDTINIKYSNINQLTSTIKKLEKLFKNKEKNHKRISQIALIIRVRLNIIKKNNKNNNKKYNTDLDKRIKLINLYTDFLKTRTKHKTFKDRASLTFKFK
jgi:hypothetical protein